VRKTLALAALLALAACGRRPFLASFSGPLGSGGRTVLGFGFTKEVKAPSRGALVYLFVFEPDPATARRDAELFAASSSSYHDGDVIRQTMSFSPLTPEGETLEKRSLELVVDRKDDSFRIGTLTGTPAAGRVVLIGVDASGVLSIKKQLPPPGPILLHADGAKALLEGPLGQALGLRP
jgi:hypothetical protein